MSFTLTMLNTLNRVIPKADIVILNSFPDMSGNVFELYKYLAQERPELFAKYRFVWAINDGNLEKCREAALDFSGKLGIQFVKKKSPKGLWLYCRAKKIITTHNYISGLFTVKGQTHYNLWHGMPYKKIGTHLGTAATEKDKLQGDCTIATSELYQGIMSEAFDILKENVMITGQPVCDALHRKTEAYTKLGFSKDKFDKAILWLPTYRKSEIGAIHEDGKADSFGVQTVLESGVAELETALRNNRCLLVIKPHPMDVLCKMKFKSDCILVLHQEDMLNAGVDLYEMLAETDALLTDYSSVFIDYLTLQKPIGFVYDDLEQYAKSRGIYFDPPADYLPGEKIKDVGGLISFIEKLGKEDNWVAERQRINTLFNVYSDDKSCKRVADFIFG